MINDNSYLDKNGLIQLLQDLSEKIRNKIGNSLTEDNRSKLATIGLIIDALNDIKNLEEETQLVISAALNDLNSRINNASDNYDKILQDITDLLNKKLDKSENLTLEEIDSLIY